MLDGDADSEALAVELVNEMIGVEILGLIVDVEGVDDNCTVFKRQPLTFIKFQTLVERTSLKF